MTPEQITEAQRLLGPEHATRVLVERVDPHTKVSTYHYEPHPRAHVAKRHNLRRNARWWELEAMRGYPSADDSRRYARNLRWLVELIDNGVDIDRPFHVLLKERSLPMGARE